MQSNKMYAISYLVIFIFMMNGHAQVLNQNVVDSTRNREILIDYVNKEGLQTGEFESHYMDEYSNYSADNDAINKLKESLAEYDILIVLASWCIDSKEQVPRFLRILDLAAYPEEKLLMLAVDSNKKARDVETDFLDIVLVPTFILYKEGIEKGRIVETPEKSLELDLLRIIE
jgi:thiol-disulfide isomerase/thioredoxin